jgi:hypothetical protein
MDGIEYHYVKRSKMGKERQMPHDFIHMWNIKKVDLIQVEYTRSSGKDNLIKFD